MVLASWEERHREMCMCHVHFPELLVWIAAAMEHLTGCCHDSFLLKSCQAKISMYLLHRRLMWLYWEDICVVTLTPSVLSREVCFHLLCNSDQLEQGFKSFLESWVLVFLFQGFGILCKCQIYSLLSSVVLRESWSLQNTCWNSCNVLSCLLPDP